MNEETQQLVQLLLAHKWLAATALIVGLLTRLFKSDTKVPFDVSPRWRPLVPIALGLASGVLKRMVDGTAWKPALLEGLASGVVAILGHVFVIDVGRGGKEFVVPGLTLPGVAPGPGKPPSIPPPPSVPRGGERGFTNFDLMFVNLLVGGLAFALVASCSADQTRRIATPTLSMLQKGCIIANAFLDDATIKTLCKVTDVLAPEVRDLIAAGKSAGHAREGAGYAQGQGIPLEAFEATAAKPTSPKDAGVH